jgi:hypothetical protein
MALSNVEFRKCQIQFDLGVALEYKFGMIKAGNMRIS